MEKIVYDGIANEEDKHWWFKARREIIVSQLQSLDLNFEKALDIGCFSGRFLKEIAPMCKERYGVESSEEGNKYWGMRDFTIVRGALPKDIPFPDKTFDIVSALDVLEHVADDRASFQTIYNLLKPHGVLLCTVPAYAFLWSDLDVMTHHYRRYSAQGLRKMLCDTGFSIYKLTYFNTFLFPLIVLVRWLRKFYTRSGTDMDKPKNIVNLLLYHIFAAEKPWLLKYTFPFGVSILVIATKNE
jgi:SAM-dependent methyltransferase